MSPKIKNGHTHKCKRCNHVWIGSLELPRVCIKCKSPYWNKERIEKRVRTGITKRYQITCKRCNKTWSAETEHPVLCRFCKNVYWDCKRKKDIYREMMMR